MKLQIGGDERYPGWVNFNVRPGPAVDLVGDCRDLSLLPDGTIETLYASHVLEHNGFKELGRILLEWKRVLRPGGELLLSVPDIEICCRLFVDPELTGNERATVLLFMFGTGPGAHDYHHCGLSWEFLSAFLVDAGFADIRRVGSLGLFQDTSEHQFRGQPISLNVMARKP